MIAIGRDRPKRLFGLPPISLVSVRNFFQWSNDSCRLRALIADCLHVLARSCYRHPGALAKSARQRLKILLARPLPSYALAAMLKHVHRGPPITGGVGGSGNGHGRINASPAALIRARPFCSSFAGCFGTPSVRSGQITSQQSCI